jgi:hypothetical protein
MTALDLDGLEALIARATATPWEARQDGVAEMNNITAFITANDGRAMVSYGHLSFNDRDTIVAAVNALPHLISHVRSAEAERDGLREALNNISRRYSNGADASTLAWLARKALSTGNQEGGA